MSTSPTLSSPDHQSTSCGTILVVDDEPLNRELLKDLLEPEGHTIIQAENGEEALQLTTEHSPHVILLDVMMPPPDGIEVCRILKNKEETASIPIVLITALRDRKSRLKGIEAGANDFLTKPIDTTETVLRVRNYLKLKKLHDLATARFHRLQQLEAMRDNLVHMLVHDLKVPLSAIIGYTKLLENKNGQIIGAKELKYLRKISANSTRMLEMIGAVLGVSKLESDRLELKLEAIDLNQVIDSVLDQWQPLLPPSKVTFTRTQAEQKAVVVGDKELLIRVLSNLLDNAIRHVPRTDGKISLDLIVQEQYITLSVTDNGPGIKEEMRTKIFDKYSQLSSTGRYSAGLGLTFCKMAIEKMGGDIGVECPPSGGSRFWFRLRRHNMPGE